MIGPLLLSFLFTLAGLITLLPDHFATFTREYVGLILVGLVLLGALARWALLALDLTDPHTAATTARTAPAPEGATL